MLLGRDAPETVAAAGGLLFDRAGGGWVVEVYLDQPAESAAFDILGVPRESLAAGIRRMRIWPDAVIVSPALYTESAIARRLFVAAAHRSLTEVALWGDTWPHDAGPGIGRVEHRLSTAAVAFKRHAMIAVGLGGEVASAEPFRSGKRRFSTAAPLTPTA